MIDRVIGEIAAGQVPLRRSEVTAEAERLLALASPIHAQRWAASITDRVLGLGPLEPLLDDPTITDILVNGPDEVWVDRGGVLTRVEARFSGEADVYATVERVIAPLGLRVDRSSPMVDGRLGDGSRIHVVVPPAAVDHPIIAIRRFTQAVASLDELVTTGTATRGQVELLSSAVEERRTVLVSGGTGTGKTTLLNLLAGLIPPGERVVTIEDAAELRIPGHRVRLEAHPANPEGVGEVTIRQLLRSALRLRPDRLIVGEVRGREALDLIWALNTGHRGSLSTIHANTPQEALWRLETLALSAGDTAELAVRRQLLAAIDLVVQLERSDGSRAITEIAAVGPDGIEDRS
ncbi:MAG TPA: ATPase, T2SS/T4P/T4SS family [Acidimicrobiia bacterium]|nr:ATPase, T2SS/T4P/T4SS family [Acidimicrobiia bacterium]